MFILRKIDFYKVLSTEIQLYRKSKIGGFLSICTLAFIVLFSIYAFSE